jgi:flagellar motor switch protein FliM
MNELDRLLLQLVELISQINRTNTHASLRNGVSLTDALAQRDVMKLRLSIFKSIADTASRRIEHYSRSEIRNVATIDIGALRKQTDQLAQQHRELDTAIQEINWLTELIA